MAVDDKIGEALVKEQKITTDQLKAALHHQKTTGLKLGNALIKLGYATEDDILEALSRRFSVPAVNLKANDVDQGVLKLIPYKIAKKYEILPVSRSGATLTIAMADPTNVAVIDDIKFLTGYNVEPVLASDKQIRESIQKYYGTSYDMQMKQVMEQLKGQEGNIEVAESAAEEIDLAALAKESEDAPVIKFVNLILSEALERGASDIHVEPYEQALRVRFRIDGVLYETLHPPLEFKSAIASRIKILSRLDIAERRLPQDGRIRIRVNSKGVIKEVDIRTSVVPTIHGEKIVLRLLDKENLRLDLTQLGFEKDSQQRFEEAILSPFGMVLVTGPTGSGKTNTLYSAVNRLNQADVNIMTVEDPVEFNIAGINQIQVKDAIGLNFAAALRAFLRQDPNIIMVGEVRDFETAEIAIKAALTGHLVLSTLHTNDAAGSISRLMNMGIEPFLVSTSLLLVCAQRLVRRVCKHCKSEVSIPPKALVDIGFSPDEATTIKVYKGKGCENCNMTGYRGRVGLFEVMDVTDDVRELILSGASSLEIKEKAIEQGMITLRKSGLCKIRDGVTTIEEVLRETVR